MKVILLKDVAKLGRRHDMKDVSDGHALNQLIPQGLVALATPALVKKVEAIKAEDAKKRAAEEAKAAEMMAKVKASVVHIETQANEKGHLFSAVSKGEIIKNIEQVTGTMIMPELLVLEKPIKEAGEYTLELKHGAKAVKFSLVVKAAK